MESIQITYSSNILETVSFFIFRYILANVKKQKLQKVKAF